LGDTADISTHTGTRRIVVEEIQLWPEGRVCALTDVHLEAGHGGMAGQRMAEGTPKCHG